MLDIIWNPAVGLTATVGAFILVFTGFYNLMKAKDDNPWYGALAGFTVLMLLILATIVVHATVKALQG